MLLICSLNFFRPHRFGIWIASWELIIENILDNKKGEMCEQYFHKNFPGNIDHIFPGNIDQNYSVFRPDIHYKKQ
jgi:hypothetical protein